ncbi:Xylanase inhibitor, C-terminal [Sesbania bispinosa]|nr:Xylanase inhibitor, C-terminal [Sesbania bispinosa]
MVIKVSLIVVLLSIFSVTFKAYTEVDDQNDPNHDPTLTTSEFSNHTNFNAITSSGNFDKKAKSSESIQLKKEEEGDVAISAKPHKKISRREQLQQQNKPAKASLASLESSKMSFQDSSSFRNLTCHDPRWFKYNRRFFIRTFTVNLTWPNGKEKFKEVVDVMFGCGHWNRGYFHGAAGLLGLGRGPLSFSSQLQSIYGHSFSYCLADLFSNTSISSKLIFGEDKDLWNHPNLNFTSLLGGEESPDDTFYYLQIKSIVVGLPYKVELPEFGIHFADGAVWNFPKENYFYPYEPDEVICLAILKTPDHSPFTIIGNLMQQNFHIMYDLKKYRLGYSPRRCAEV